MLSLDFGLFSLHASLSDATSVRSIAKSDPRALLGGEQIPVLRCYLILEPADERMKLEEANSVCPMMPPYQTSLEKTLDKDFHLFIYVQRDLSLLSYVFHSNLFACTEI